jgi:hypothetical protein
VRLFLRKRRVEVSCSVYTRSENAVERRFVTWTVSSSGVRISELRLCLLSYRMG